MGYDGSMNVATLADDEALGAALSAPRFLLFKHSLVCPVSARAWRELERFLAEHPALPCAWIDVIGSRPLSRTVAERTGVRHESPQALVLADGRCVWHASHGAISAASLASAWADAAQSGPKR